jgi:signal peptidase I
VTQGTDINEGTTQAGPEEERRPAAIPDTPEAPRPAEASTLADPVPTTGTSKDDGENQSFVRWLVEFVVLVGLAFLLATGIKYFVVQPFFIPSSSMVPTLEIGDRVLVNKFIYRFTQPKPGDVIVFVAPEPTNQEMDLIKRVIAVGGQTVDIQHGYVTVDGKKLDEPYVVPSNRDDYTLPKPVRIPQGYVWVMGDNRANSSDSRVIGPQPVTAILGKAFVIYWPLDRIRGL